MKSYLITFDLNKEGQDYEAIIKRIEGLGAYRKCLKNTWVVKTSWTAPQICDYLIKQLDKNDSVLVVELTGNASWSSNLGDSITNWLKNTLASISL